jgi:predicted molibdopterin-dependent oxidoreductase YjgC
VLELLASSVELDRTPGIAERLAEYGADPSRFGPAAATVAAPAIVDNELYVRDYARCILCYQCVDACGEQWQGTFAIAVAGRGFDARISTEWAVELPMSACVYCGNCIAVCPTGALVPHREFELRAADAWKPEAQTRTDTICPYCGVGCTLTLHVQDDEIVKVTSPHDNDVTHGNLCVKGRFGWQFVHVGTTRRRAR